MSPSLSASSEEIGSDSNSISRAFLVDGRDRINSTPGVLQNKPTFSPGVAKAAFFVAVSKSHDNAS